MALWKYGFPLLALLLLGPRLHAGGCPAEYNAEQCAQLDDTDSGGNSGGNACPYYLCSNSEPDVRSYYVWCSATQSYTDCPTTACYYRSCIGSNCTIDTSVQCENCTERRGSNVHVSTCPTQ
jgi:hypothetical protein